MTIQERWIAGSTLATYTPIAGTEVNSLVSGNAVLSSIIVDNSVIGDMYADISVSLGSVTTGAGIVFLGLYLYPLNQDGTTYGDGRFGASATGVPPVDYWVGNIAYIASTTAVIPGTARGILLPFAKFKPVFYNLLGVTMASSANTIKMITYNRKISS